MRFPGGLFRGTRKMPIYEYRCEACGHEMEAIQKMSDAPLTQCPACNASTMKKLISATGFRLKGGGWYETDFKGGTKKNLHDTGKKEPKPAPACGTGGCNACK